MKEFFRFWWRASAFTLGVALSLVALCYLVSFYEYGLNFDDEHIWLFGAFFLLGFPALLYGIKMLSDPVDAQRNAGRVETKGEEAANKSVERTA